MWTSSILRMSSYVQFVHKSSRVSLETQPLQVTPDMWTHLHDWACKSMFAPLKSSWPEGLYVGDLNGTKHLGENVSFPRTRGPCCRWETKYSELTQCDSHSLGRLHNYCWHERLTLGRLRQEACPPCEHCVVWKRLPWKGTLACHAQGQ